MIIKKSFPYRTYLHNHSLNPPLILKLLMHARTSLHTRHSHEYILTTTDIFYVTAQYNRIDLHPLCYVGLYYKRVTMCPIYSRRFREQLYVLLLLLYPTSGTRDRTVFLIKNSAVNLFKNYNTQLTIFFLNIEK